MTTQIPNHSNEIDTKKEREFLDELKNYFQDDTEVQIRWIRYSFNVDLEKAKEILYFMNWVTKT